jgi:hypothetical protein
MTSIPEAAIDAAEKTINKKPWPNRITLEKAIAAALSHLGEPVVWQRYVESMGGWQTVAPEDMAHYRKKGATIRPLYLAPPATAPLTDPPYTVDLIEAASDLLRAYAHDNRSVGYRSDLWDCLKAIMSRKRGLVDPTKKELAEALRASDQSNHDMLHLVASMIGSIRSASPKLADRFQALADTAFEKWPRTRTAVALSAFEKETEHG